MCGSKRCLIVWNVCITAQQGKLLASRRHSSPRRRRAPLIPEFNTPHGSTDIPVNPNQMWTRLYSLSGGCPSGICRNDTNRDSSRGLALGKCTKRDLRGFSVARLLRPFCCWWWAKGLRAHIIITQALLQKDGLCSWIDINLFFVGAYFRGIGQIKRRVVGDGNYYALVVPWLSINPKNRFN